MAPSAAYVCQLHVLHVFCLFKGWSRETCAPRTVATPGSAYKSAADMQLATRRVCVCTRRAKSIVVFYCGLEGPVRITTAVTAAPVQGLLGVVIRIRIITPLACMASVGCRQCLLRHKAHLHGACTNLACLALSISIVLGVSLVC